MYMKREVEEGGGGYKKKESKKISGTEIYNPGKNVPLLLEQKQQQ